MEGNMIDALLNVAVFAALVLCIVGFSAWARQESAAGPRLCRIKAAKALAMRERPLLAAKRLGNDRGGITEERVKSHE
jgi:hypothetical protein